MFFFNRGEKKCSQLTRIGFTLEVMVKLELNLPWKPVLAWPWGVEYSIDPDTFLITKHEESWDIEPWEVRS